MDLADKKEMLIRNLIEEGYLKSPGVISAFREIPREGFVGDSWRDYAYSDQPLDIGSGQTISAPHMVAIMTELIKPEKSHLVLEIGAGSGYQAAILSRLVKKVYSIELEHELAGLARENLKRAGIRNVEVIQGDGSLGIPGKSPFDRIVVTCGSDKVYPAWREQAREGGIILSPVDEGDHQRLMILRKGKGGFSAKKGLSCVFVPLRH